MFSLLTSALLEISIRRVGSKLADSWNHHEIWHKKIAELASPIFVLVSNMVLWHWFWLYFKSLSFLNCWVISNFKFVFVSIFKNLILITSVDLALFTFLKSAHFSQLERAHSLYSNKPDLFKSTDKSITRAHSSG